MQRDGKFVLKFICYGLLTVLVYLLETGTPLHRVRLLDVSVDVLACLPAAAALFEGPALGTAIGFLTGLLYDLAGNGIEGLYPLYFMLFAALAGGVSGRWLRRIWPSHLLLTAGGMLALRLIQFGLMMVVDSGFPALAFLQSMYAQVLVALLFSPVIYLLCRFIARRFDPFK